MYGLPHKNNRSSTTYKSIAEMEGGSTINSQFGGGSFGTSSSGMRGTGAVDFNTVCNNQYIHNTMHTTVHTYIHSTTTQT